MKKFLKALFMSEEERRRMVEDAYLAGAEDIHDLEFRQRQIDRGALHRRYTAYY